VIPFNTEKQLEGCNEGCNELRQLVLSLDGGHRQRSETRTIKAAAIKAGARLRASWRMIAEDPRPIKERPAQCTATCIVTNFRQMRTPLFFGRPSPPGAGAHPDFRGDHSLATTAFQPNSNFTAFTWLNGGFLFRQIASRWKLSDCAQYGCDLKIHQVARFVLDARDGTAVNGGIFCGQAARQVLLAYCRRAFQAHLADASANHISCNRSSGSFFHGVCAIHTLDL
jgi:hypothetical protein